MAWRTRLGIHTVSHFTVDFCCLYVLFAFFNRAAYPARTVAAGFLLYNVLAFGLQTPAGFLADVRPRFPLSRLGCALVLLALPLGFALPGAAVITAALGNACFHVGGGVDTLLCSGGRIADSGVFVSSGSLGVLLGTLAGNAAVPWLVPALLAAVCLALECRVSPAAGEAPGFFAADPARPLPVSLLLLFAAVVLRAYVGFVVPLPWKTSGLFLALPAAAAFLGKAMGGFLADRFGARRTGCLALALSAVLLGAGYRSPVLASLGILLFNIPMPVTLAAFSDRLPGRAGVAFGLTTLALLLGAVPTFYCTLPADAAPWVVAFLTLAALGCLYPTTLSLRRHSHGTF